MIAAALVSGASQRWVANVADAATGGLIAAVWQGALLSLLVALGLRLLPKAPAAVRFAIWFGVFLVVAALPSAGLLHYGDGAVNGHAAWLTLDERWCVIVAAVWLVASLARAATLLLAVLRVRSLWKRATRLELAHEEIGDPGKLRDLAQLRALAGSRRAELCVSDELDRPTVIGFFSPKILIPAWLVRKLTADELQQIVLHETGHLSRADDWINLLQKIALVVFPLNPALAWVERRLCFERELACDERVLETTGAPKAYAACLATLAEHRLGQRGLVLALGALGRESELGRRVRKILSRGERMRPVQVRLVLCGAMFGLLAAAAVLERCPQMVGFASSADRVAVASGPVLRDGGMGDTYTYQPVIFRSPVFHSQDSSALGMRAMASVRREHRPAQRSVQATAASSAGNELLLASVSEPKDAQNMSRDAEQDVRSQQVFGSDAAVGDASLDNVEAQAPSPGVVRWFVVTSWRGDDGSHVVLTSLRSASPDGSSATNGLSQQDQVHPYAAVPVRDGWLLIQL